MSTIADILQKTEAWFRAREVPSARRQAQATVGLALGVEPLLCRLEGFGQGHGRHGQPATQQDQEERFHGALRFRGSSPILGQPP